ncbi:CAP-associated domain-containing protein [Paenibacillus filicis]|uniref:CAP-associated domain-containing protein n=1 Tax=Paenibacillus gyeongsangnamensis TaxID=3388067 RepID=A0ABT4Q7B3_9BACL|nr:CAP-associated domain-containing protein [Paenibacillus filicis]MCZ8512765.1 CAP-associated domain-containing protein [Paenibacillus filicis]
MKSSWLLTRCLSAALVLSCTLSVHAAGTDAAAPRFSDTANHWAQDSINWAVQNKVIDGYEDHTFRPDQTVAETEFLAMLLRAYPGGALTPASSAEPWYAPYYRYADSKHWPTLHSADPNQYNRGLVARLIAASAGQQASISVIDAVKYLLEQKLSQGKTSATVDGYQASDRLSRAEAVTFIRNLKSKPHQPVAASGEPDVNRNAVPTPPANPQPPVQAALTAFAPLPAAGLSSANTDASVSGIAIGDPVTSVIAKLGDPARKDPSEYGFQWYIYNQSYADYVQIGVRDDQVVGLYASGLSGFAGKGLTDRSTREEVLKLYGNPLAGLVKGNTRFVQNYGKNEYGTYDLGKAYVTFFYDLYSNNAISGIQVIEKSTEQALAAFYPAASDELARAYERESFDLANAGRARMGLPAFAWDDAAAGTARGHSQDMADNAYFDHTDRSGQTPFDRMKNDGIRYHAAAENIAAGQTSAIFAHHGWMNSEGHRKNLLSPYARLGVGVAFGGPMHLYYTQNFYTP